MGTAVAGTSFRPARSYTTLWDVTSAIARREGKQAHPDPAKRPGMVRAPWRSGPSWPLQVQKTDSIRWRIDPSEPKRGFSSLRSGRRKVAPRSAMKASKSRPAKPLSAIAVSREAHPFEHLGRDLALGGVGWGQFEGDRRAVGGAVQIEAEPQK